MYTFCGIFAIITLIGKVCPRDYVRKEKSSEYPIRWRKRSI